MKREIKFGKPLGKFPIKFQFSKKIKLILKLIPVAIIVLIIIINSFSVTIGPNEFGVKTKYFGPHKGIQKEILDTGLYIVIPGYEKIEKFPKDIQVIEMTNHRIRMPIKYRLTPAVTIQTSEGYGVTVDITILYFIKDPYLVRSKLGTRNTYEDKVLAICDKVLRQSLGSLNAEDFYNVEKRTIQTKLAERELNSELNSKGLEIAHVLVRYYAYDSDYQKNIEERKVQDQLVFTREAQAKAAKELAKQKKIKAEGEAKVALESKRGETEVKKIMAEAESYRRKKIAEGDLLVKLAEAEGTKLINEAYKGRGAEKLVEIMAIDALKDSQTQYIIFNDLKDFISLFTSEFKKGGR